MSRHFRQYRPFLCVIALAQAWNAHAFCEDPKTHISGYHVPLAEEVKTSVAIVIGQVVAEKRIFEVIEDPDYYYSGFTFRIDEQLKGDLPKEVTLRMELTSARYAMRLGEKHVLFIRKWPWKVESADFVIDSCGSSSQLPEGDEVVSQVIATMRSASMRRNTSLERTSER